MLIISGHKINKYKLKKKIFKYKCTGIKKLMTLTIFTV